MIDIVIDGNYIFNRFAYAQSNSSKSLIFLESEDDKKFLIYAIIHMLSNTLQKFRGSIGEVYFVFDSGISFRRKLYSEYKGNRQRDKVFRYSDLEKCMVNFADITSNILNPILYKDMEGDDLIYFISIIKANQKRNLIIMSGDSDLRQNIMNTNDSFIICFDPFTKIYFGESPIIDKTESFDITESLFNMDASDLLGGLNFNGIISIINSNSKFINPKEALMIKILSGDKKSDNIPSCYHYQKGKTMVSFTDLRAKQLLENFGVIDSKFVSNLYLDQDFRLKLAEAITNLTKTDISNKEIISEAIIRNMDLIWLNKNVYDKYLSESQITDCVNRII
jgi:5'-3' exonuclease